jgi:formiminotetrahydrofolate cyclodeaminase
MVCRLTVGKKKYTDVEAEMQDVFGQADRLREQLSALIDKDTQAFNKVMEAYGLPKETEAQKALRSEAIQSTTMEAALVPLEVMHHCLDGLALARIVAQKGNANSTSDAGVSALMLVAAAESAALNVRINLNSIKDADFTTWRAGEVRSLVKSAKAAAEEIASIVDAKIGGA